MSFGWEFFLPLRAVHHGDSRCLSAHGEFMTWFQPRSHGADSIKLSPESLCYWHSPPAAESI